MKEFAVILVLAMLVAAGATSTGEPVFIEEPSLAVVAENDTTEFRCRVSSGAQGWAVNGTFTSSVHNPDIEERSELATDGGPPVHTLSIVARSVYNGTTVECFIFPDNITSNTTLLIQGPLGAVTNLTAEAGTAFIRFHWGAPFSLNLTNTEPDITYCVEAYHPTNEGRELVVSECGLTETSYNFTANERNPCDSFTAVVTPVNGAGNGSTALMEGHYLMRAPMLSGEEHVTYKILSGTQAGKLSISIEELPSVPICTCELVFTSVDGVSPSINGERIMISDCKNMLIASGGIIVDTTNATSETTQDAVPLHRIYALDIVLQNFAGNATIKQVDLSTHGVQEITQMDSQNEKILAIEFIENTVAPGSVVIIVDGEVEFVFISYLPEGSIRVVLRVSGLNEESYTVSAYDLDDRTTAGRYIARNITVDGSTGETNEPSTVDIEGAVKAESILIQPSSDRMVCASCSDDSVTQCLLLMHPLGDLTEIEALYVPINEDNCTQVRNSGEYHVSSFGIISTDGIDSIATLSTAPVPFTVPLTTAPTATVPTDGGSSVGPAVVGGVIAGVLTVVVIVVVVMVVIGVVVIVVIGVVVVVVKKRNRKSIRTTGHDRDLACDDESGLSNEMQLTTDSTMPLPNRATPKPIPSPIPTVSMNLRKQRPSRMATDSSPPTSPPEDRPFKFEKSSDVANGPDKVVEEGTTGPVYVTANPDRRFTAPLPQDTTVNYDVVTGVKS